MKKRNPFFVLLLITSCMTFIGCGGSETIPYSNTKSIEENELKLQQAKQKTHQYQLELEQLQKTGQKEAQQEIQKIQQKELELQKAIQEYEAILNSSKK